MFLKPCNGFVALQFKNGDEFISALGVVERNNISVKVSGGFKLIIQEKHEEFFRKRKLRYKKRSAAIKKNIPQHTPSLIRRLCYPHG